jgi:uncharacterized membrane protein
VGAYAGGVWTALTVWAALAEYVLPTRGAALGKLGSFHWVFVINLLPALLCAFGFATGRVLVRSPLPVSAAAWRVALVLGSLFPLSLVVLRPVFAVFGHGLVPAIVWCVVGSAIAGGVFGSWERRRVP